MPGRLNRGSLGVMADGLVLVQAVTRIHFEQRRRERASAETAGLMAALAGNAAVFRGFLDRLQAENLVGYGDLLATLVRSLGIWLPVEAYADLPVVLPHVLRDNGCRRARGAGMAT